MTYEEGLAWIHDQLKFGIKPGIERMKWLLNELGNPQEKVKGIHVVGTNGKGSTVNYLQTMFTEAGYEVGTFTSPYIMDFRERIALNGEMISKEDLLHLLSMVKPLAERLPSETGYEPATEFEIITAMMFLYFGQVHPVDIAIIEAGLGGLYDSTNIFKPLAVICTSIGLDHQTILGQTYEEIATQKVGVLKDNVPFVFAENRIGVKSVFYKKANEMGSQTFEMGHDFEVSGHSRAFDFIGQGFKLEKLTLKMRGQHQVTNASLALMTALLLQEKYPQLTEGVLRNALAKASWLGRIEFLEDNLMIDGAHNNESIAVLVALLKKEFAEKNIHILFSAIDTKPIQGMIEQLATVGELTLTTFNYPNAVPLEHYPSAYPKVANFKEWLNTYKSSEEDLYVITGSLYFISQVRQFLLEK
ncbi:bifunctional folylpolyglutamate synthase/dihydrofolate synthase [Streptococcus halotolerans]|uniref:bifunctional folylpolyglutamate synthase/dihydrofolate synthase n=1 Tax=Streptococcus halotolerans TaxID=1814128 RepID=UPI000787549B|nr:folylpolyglutamate synthase/dihydrofolate synthase family protein [Streptococcus halotolerans]